MKFNSITTLFTTVLCIVVLGSCTAPSEREGSSEFSGQHSNTPIAGTPGAADAAHNSRNALDWQGTYAGVLPCADCEGIETTVTLLRNGTYTRTTRYLGKDGKVFREEGTFTWNDAGSFVTLQSGDGSEQMYKVGENVLFHLDREGKMITGTLSGKYRLEKNSLDARMENKKWPAH